MERLRFWHLALPFIGIAAWWGSGFFLVYGDLAPIYSAPIQWDCASGRSCDFRADLTKCVRQNDPSHLFEMDNGGTYELRGWFVSRKRTDPVFLCMVRQGYGNSAPSL